MKYLSLLLTFSFFSISIFAQEHDPCFSVNDYNLLIQEQNQNITKDFTEGWNMFGFPCSNNIDAIDAFSEITDKIILVKNNDGSVYMPEFGFNGIGMLESGEGYQIKMSSGHDNFSFCESISYPTIEGCTNCEALNFNHWANTDDGSCIIPITQQNIHDAVDLWCVAPDSAETIYGHISNWNTSNITDMSELFYNKSEFNVDISNWDVSNVTNMLRIFQNATLFNSDISQWNVSNVINMEKMFNSAVNFNSNISNWNVSNTVNMRHMFDNATSFNGSLLNWDVSNVTNMGHLFDDAISFNGDLSNWNVSNVTDMFQMFLNASSFNSDLSNWDVSNVMNMNAMFRYASLFNSDLSNWDVGNVFDMSQMFLSAYSFNSELSDWNVSNVVNMNSTFWGASSFNNDISNWDVSNVTDMEHMFFGVELSSENQCAIQNSFSSNENWLYDWECPLAVGNYAEGGIIFYIDESGERGLVASLEDLEGTYEWGCMDVEIGSNFSAALGEGYQNTVNIINQDCITANDAAIVCDIYQINNYSDWYLPSQDELHEMFMHLNISGVYWSSSQNNSSQSWSVASSTTGVPNSKNSSLKVRPIRAFGNWIMGCMDESACNYNDVAIMSDGSCEYPEQGYDCDGNISVQVGDLAFGGIVFYVDESGEHGLVAALENLEGDYEWGCYGTELFSWGQHIGEGYQNTLQIVSSCSDTNSAAFNALNATINGYTDWYLPSKYELIEMCSTLGNEGLEGDIGGFNEDYYWSSTEENDSFAWFYSSIIGDIGSTYKINSYKVRTIRAF